MFCATLAIALNGFDEMKRVLPVANALAQRHPGYGVWRDGERCLSEPP